MSLPTITEEEEDKMYHSLRQLPDFMCFPLPARWFKKYNIPPLEPTNVREYIHSNYAFNCMYTPKELDPIIINKPQTDLSGNVKFVKMVEVEKVDVKLSSKPYEEKSKDE